MVSQIPARCLNSSSLIITAHSKLEYRDIFNYKILFLKRHAKSSFMPNSLVFPGGMCEPADESPLWYKHFNKFGITKKQLQLLIPVKGDRTNTVKNELGSNQINLLDRDISLRITAIRETFEEIGIMLCRNRSSFLDENFENNYSYIEDNFDRKHWQQAIHNDPSKFLTLCEKLDVMPDIFNMIEWSNWITPAIFQKRFDTVFYIVALRQIADCLLETKEMQDYSWKSPIEYLNNYHEGKSYLPPPQLYELSRCLNFKQLFDLLYFAKMRMKQSSRNIALLPVQYKCTNGLVNLLPGDHFYPINPNASTDVVNIKKSIEELRDESKQMHRFEMFGPYNVMIRVNLEPSDKHIFPINYQTNQMHKL